MQTKSLVMSDQWDKNRYTQAYNQIITNARKYDKDADIRGVLVGPQSDKGIGQGGGLRLALGKKH